MAHIVKVTVSKVQTTGTKFRDRVFAIDSPVQSKQLHEKLCDAFVDSLLTEAVVKAVAVLDEGVVTVNGPTCLSLPVCLTQKHLERIAFSKDEELEELDFGREYRETVWLTINIT